MQCHSIVRWRQAACRTSGLQLKPMRALARWSDEERRVGPSLEELEQEGIVFPGIPPIHMVLFINTKYMINIINEHIYVILNKCA